MLVTWVLAGLCAVPAGPRAHAVVIGINDSPSPELPALRYADDDAVQYAQLFSELGMAVHLLAAPDAATTELHPRLELAGPPTAAALRRALAEVADDWRGAGATGELYLVYAGHGDVAHGQGFLVLADGPYSRSDLRRDFLDGI